MSASAPGPVVALSDLDRTLIYSAAAVRALGRDGVGAPATCVETYEGAPLSFVTTRAAPLLERLAGTGRLVPTTTRTVEQYARVRLPGPVPPYAICTNGGRLLVDGVEDLAFSAGVAARLEASSAPLAEVLAGVTRMTPYDAPWVERVRVASGLFVYLVLDRPRLPPAWIEELTGVATTARWTVSLQGRKLYLVPGALTKSWAGREVAGRLGATTVVAAGDSLLDAELLESADRAIRPAHGELAEAGWSRPHVEVTAGAGIVAGEQVAAWLLDRVGRLGPSGLPAGTQERDPLRPR